MLPFKAYLSLLALNAGLIGNAMKALKKKSLGSILEITSAGTIESEFRALGSNSSSSFINATASMMHDLGLVSSIDAARSLASALSQALEYTQMPNFGPSLFNVAEAYIILKASSKHDDEDEFKRKVDFVKSNWFNSLLNCFWPWINRFLDTFMKDPNAVILKSLHGIIGMSGAYLNTPSRDLVLGATPLQAENVNIRELPARRGLQIDADISFTPSWSVRADQKITIGLATGIWTNIEGLKIRGPLSIRLDPMSVQGSLPFGGIVVFFRDTPQASLTLGGWGGANFAVKAVDTVVATKQWFADWKSTLTGMMDTGFQKLVTCNYSRPEAAQQQAETREEWHNGFFVGLLRSYTVLPNAISKAFGADEETALANNPIRPLGMLELWLTDCGGVKLSVTSFSTNEPATRIGERLYVTVLDVDQPLKVTLGREHFEGASLRTILKWHGRPYPLARPCPRGMFQSAFHAYHLASDGLQGRKFSNANMGFLRAKIRAIRFTVASDRSAQLSDGTVLQGPYSASVEMTIYLPTEGGNPPQEVVTKRTKLLRETIKEELLVKIGSDDWGNLQQILEAEWITYSYNVRGAKKELFFQTLRLESRYWTTPYREEDLQHMKVNRSDFPIRVYAKPEAPGSTRRSKAQGYKDFQYESHDVDLKQSLYLPVHTSFFDGKYKLKVTIHSPQSDKIKVPHDGRPYWHSFEYSLKDIADKEIGRHRDDRGKIALANAPEGIEPSIVFSFDDLVQSDADV